MAFSSNLPESVAYLVMIKFLFSKVSRDSDINHMSAVKIFTCLGVRAYLTLIEKANFSRYPFSETLASFQKHCSALTASDTECCQTKFGLFLV